MTIVQIYNSYYKHIPLDVFNTAVAADPTSYNQGKIVKVGSFVKWILKLYSNDSWKPGDSYETRDLLTKFNKYKSKLPLEKRDINRFNSISELYSLIQTLENDGVKTQSDVKREGAEVVYEDSEWKIVIPHTEEASCIYGANTKWCTAGREHNMFDYYNKKGPLYININKVSGDKYQFHFETNSFRDAEDKEISPRKIGLSEGAIDYYNSIGKEPYFIYDNVGKFSEGFTGVKLEGRGWNWIDTNGELLWDKDKWFDVAGWKFYEGFACVKLEGKGWNFINTKGELLWSEYKNFNLVIDFSEGFARVKIEGRGWNFINQQGELLWKGDKWFDGVSYFYNGFARVEIIGKGWNFIDTNGELLWKEYKNFNVVDDFREGFARVKIAGRRWNYINQQGKLLLKEDIQFVNSFSEGLACVQIEWKGWNVINTQGELLWSEYKNYDGVYIFFNGFAMVYKKGLGYNFINHQGELLWKEDEWFDGAYYFDEGFAEVKYKGKWYKLNTKGELIEN